MTTDRRPMLLGGLAALAVACARPQPPTITPRSAEVSSANSQGLGLRVHCVLRNGNSFPLTVQRVSVRLTLAARDLGVTQISSSLRLPTNTDVPMDIEVRAPWGDLPAIIAVSMFNENIPYRLNGTAQVGGERLNVSVPFALESTLPRSVLTNAATNIATGAPRAR
jgi:LEA14-like dessication related protein